MQSGVRSGTTPLGAVNTQPGSHAARRRLVHLRRAAVPFIFLAPFLVLFTFFFLVPLGYAFQLSLYVTRMVGGTVFVGSANYVQVLQDSNFWDGVIRVVLYGIVIIPLGLGLALLFALCLDSGAVPLAALFRLGFFLPYAVPGVVAALLWGYLYGPTFGPFGQLASHFGLPPPPFLTDAGMLPSIGNISIWLYTGSNMVIFFAALQSIPVELYEAAVVDGATARQIAWYIKVPLIRPAFVMMSILSIIGTLQMFTEPSILGPLAPDVITPHYTPNLYAYNLTATGEEFNYVATISFTLGAVIVICSSLFLLVVNRRRIS
jgi:multiple sugar transport system permease protein